MKLYGTLYCVKIDNHFLSGDSSGDRAAMDILEYVAHATREANGKLLLGKQTRALAVQAVRNIIAEERGRNAAYRCAIKKLVFELLLCIARDPHHRKPFHASVAQPRTQSRLREALRFIAANYMEPIQVEHTARVANVSQGHFQHLLKQETGQTFVQYLNRIRVGHAKSLLESTSLPIIEVSSRCGFSSLSHFYHVFKRAYGTSPKAVRMSTDRIR